MKVQYCVNNVNVVSAEIICQCPVLKDIYTDQLILQYITKHPEKKKKVVHLSQQSW